jgi:hypothetical protein
MSYGDEISEAFAEAQSALAQIQGMAEDAAGNFIGPDGKPYTLVFRAADAFETQAAGQEMSSHGFGGKSVMIATGTRDQFSASPVGWRGQNSSRLIPAPATEARILSVATDDPVHYVFTLIFRQEATRG